MKNTHLHSKRWLFRSLVIGLSVLQGFAIAAPCYRNTGGNVGCLSQGGSGQGVCATANPALTLPCMGGPWVAADFFGTLNSLNDPCHTNGVDLVGPKHAATSGGNATGYQNQDYYNFPCFATETCHKQVIWPIPLEIMCVKDPAVICETIDIFTAGGGDCPAG